jgi:hypothetical protein
MWPTSARANCCGIRHGKLWRCRSDAAYKCDHFLTVS